MALSKDANLLEQLYRRQIGDNIINFRQNFYRQRMKCAKNLYKKDLLSHYGCVNAIEFSHDGNYLVSGGDDRRVLIWNIEENLTGSREPRPMKNQHFSNIFCLRFNNDHSKVFSGGNDDAVIVHDTTTTESFDSFRHAKPVYGITVDATNDSIFATAGEDGSVVVFDLRIGSEILTLPKSRSPFHAVEFHPMDGNYLVTANGKDGAELWDLREFTSPCIRYGKTPQSCMSVRFNSMGTQILALRRRLPPILYGTSNEKPICQFYHPDYYNSCTMKSGSFAGENDEFILSGSDDFNMYMWRTTDADLDKTDQFVESAHMVLCGHRSIVNQVRYNAQRCLIASSGVEKVIKVWQPFETNGWVGSLNDKESCTDDARIVFTHDEYVSLLNTGGNGMSHDYSNQSMDEDPRMMAFFDSLVQREIEGWKSDDRSDSDMSSYHSSDGSARPTSTQQSDSDSNASDNVMANDYVRGRTGVRYMNRIQYLIASKRKRLKRLALKGSVQTTRRRKSTIVNNRKLPRNSQRGNNNSAQRGNNNSTQRGNNNGTQRGNSNNNKKRNRLSTSARNRNGSDNESSKKPTKRRQNGTARMNRRVSKSTSLNFHPIIDSDGNSSSDDESPPRLPNGNLSPPGDPIVDQSDDTDDNHNDLSLPSTSSGAQINLAMPSTSTGITDNGASYRAIQSPDSDDDPTPRNSPPITQRAQIRTIRLNGHSGPKANTTYSSGGVDDEPINDNRSYHRHTRRKRHNSVNTNFQLHCSHFSSHSSSRISNSSSSEDDAASTEGSAPLFQTVIPHRDHVNSNGNGHIAARNTPFVGECTPIASRTRHHGVDITPDSGMSSMVDSAAGSTNRKNDNQHESSTKKGTAGGSETTKLFMQKVARIRRNYRNIGGDVSYSEDSE